MTEDIRKNLLEDTSDNRYTESPVGEHPYRHGRPASWALVAVIIVAFCIGGVAVIEQWWPVIWACLAVVVLAVPAGKLIGIMDDTVAIEQLPRRRAALTGRDSAADPGVRLD
ncbi:MAG TPA: HGxxPAAW family protein [Trebonia sp.]|nr:HGxxPAAW family protein [Trebonia sp.]